MYNKLVKITENTNSFAKMLMDLDDIHETKTSIQTASVLLRKKMMETRNLIADVQQDVGSLKHKLTKDFDKEVQAAHRLLDQEKIDVYNKERAAEIADLEARLIKLKG